MPLVLSDWISYGIAAFALLVTAPPFVAHYLERRRQQRSQPTVRPNVRRNPDA